MENASSIATQACSYGKCDVYDKRLIKNECKIGFHAWKDFIQVDARIFCCENGINRFSRKHNQIKFT